MSEPSELAQRLQKAFAKAVKEEIIKHLEAGRSVKGIENGKWVELTPADLDKFKKKMNNIKCLSY